MAEPGVRNVAAMITGREQLELREFAAQPPGRGTVSVDVVLCGICGTDVAWYRTGSPHSPAVCGHEWVGIVSAVGAGVTTRTEGDRVVIGVPPPCGSCDLCRAGLSDSCVRVQAIARGRDLLAPPHGGFARSITVDADRVIAAHPALTDRELALVEPAAVAFHAIRRSQIRPGDTVVVQGAGPIGLLAQQLARIAGAGSVIVVEPSASRRQLARDLSASHAVAPDEEGEELIRDVTRGLGPDVVIECAGAPALLQTAVERVRPGGVVSLLSSIAAPTTIDAARWLAKEVTVVGSLAFTHEDHRRTVDLMVDGRLLVAPLHTRTIGLGELEDTLRLLASGASDDIKVLVDPSLG